MIELDGSLGEGGGQILRTALTLSVATGQPFRLRRIRAGRRRPGLMRQHLMCVEAATTISGARAEGAVGGSQELIFHPGTLRPGDYAFRIATAGSTTLVFQTIAPALLRGGQPFTLEFEGGTHNSMAPSLDFLSQTYLPCLHLLGAAWEMTVQRRGYYPAGGGLWRIRLTPPTQFAPLDLLQRGPLGPISVRILLARMSRNLAERERTLLSEGLKLTPDSITVEDDVDSVGPGNVALITLPCSPFPETVTLYAGYGAHTEEACQTAVAEALAFIANDIPVGLHLADQLPLVLLLAAGGRYRTGPLSPHSETNFAVIDAFLPGRVKRTLESSGNVLCEVGAAFPNRPA